ncbi:MAG: hypothetical protein RR255_00090 [Bacilli bacterium]
MLPIFKPYRNMLKSFGIDLSNYDEDKLWIDRMIIKGFSKDGKQIKICRLKVIGEYNNLTYEHSYYYKTHNKNKEIDIPDNKDLETWEETYQRLKKSIREREREPFCLRN